MTPEELNDALVLAHQNADLNSDSLHPLVNLYHQAFTLNFPENPVAAYFYLTNAYVYALDSNHESTEQLESILRDAGRL